MNENRKADLSGIGFELKTNNLTGGQSKAFSSSDYSEELEPFQLVGQNRPGRFYAKTNPMRHAIYDRLIAILENRTLQHAESGEILRYVRSLKLKELLRAEGISELEIDQGESSLINDLETHPCWNVLCDVPSGLYHQLEYTGQDDAIFKHRIVPVPDDVRNIRLCRKLLTMFDRSDLLATPGFVDRDGELRLDIDTHLPHHGFIVPVIRKGLIDALRVFRRPDDTRPFLLRSRGVGLNA